MAPLSVMAPSPDCRAWLRPDGESMFWACVGGRPANTDTTLRMLSTAMRFMSTSVGGKDFLIDRRLRDIASPLIGHCGTVPMLGMLKIILHRNLIPGHFGLLGEFQITLVLRHGAAVAGLAALTARSVISRRFLTSRKPVPEFRAVLVRRRQCHPRCLRRKSWGDFDPQPFVYPRA